MQPSPNIRRVSADSEIKTVTETNEDAQLPPPSYPSAVSKLANVSLPQYDDRPPPTSYSYSSDPSVIYINNYPGPPLTDGTVQIVTANHPSANSPGAMNNLLSKRMRIYLSVNGFLTIIFGLIAIGLQVGLVASHSIVYYYYGFWAGILIISIGIGTILMNKRHRTYGTAQHFRSVLWQTVFVTVVFAFGMIIILTDTCDGDRSAAEGNDDACKPSYKVLNGLLITVIALTLVQSIINTVIIGVLKRRRESVDEGCWEKHRK